MNQNEIVQYCTDLLHATEIKDFCPNGLQVEGDHRTVKSIALGVSISLEFIRKAIEINADLIITHHGMIWEKDSRRIMGPFRKKIAALLETGIASASYHLPLDYHPEFGNNIQLARHLELTDLKISPETGDFAESVVGTTDKKNVEEFARFVEKKLERKPLLLPFGKREIETVTIITGGAQNYYMTAVEEGADCFLTGEASEKNFAMSQEYEINYLAAGHYATEKYGIIALGNHLQQKFGIKPRFIDLPNPI